MLLELSVLGICRVSADYRAGFEGFSPAAIFAVVRASGVIEELSSLPGLSDPT